MNAKAGYRGRITIYGGRTTVPSEDVAEHLSPYGVTESNLLATLRHPRKGKPDDAALFVDAPEEYATKRKTRKHKSKMLSSRCIVWLADNVYKGETKAALLVVHEEIKGWKARRRLHGDVEEAIEPPVVEAEVVPPEVDEDDENFVPESELNALVILRADQPVTTSLRVAKQYGKLHGHVLRDIDEIAKMGMGPNLDSSVEFLFRESEYLDSRGRKKRMVEMNEPAFMMLVGGYTGIDALKLRHGFITEFYRMKEHIQKNEKPIDVNDPAQLRQMLIGYTVKLEASQAETQAEREGRRQDKITADMEKRAIEASLKPRAMAHDERSEAEGIDFSFKKAATQLSFFQKDLMVALTSKGLDRIDGAGIGWIDEPKYDEVHDEWYHLASSKGQMGGYTKNVDYVVLHRHRPNTVKTYAVLTRRGFNKLNELKQAGDMRLPGTKLRSGRKKPRSQRSFDDKFVN